MKKRVSLCVEKWCGQTVRAKMKILFVHQQPSIYMILDIIMGDLYQVSDNEDGKKI